MRRFGQLLALSGLALGGFGVLATFLPIHLAGLSWLVAVGMIKLTLVSGLGLMAGGAVLQRMAATRAAERKELPPSRES